MRLLLSLLALVIVGIVGVGYYDRFRPAGAEFFTATVTRADITESVAVTGSAEPTDVHVVQSQVPGMVQEVLVDYNEPVQKDQVLARLVSDIQRVQVMQAEAGLKASKAELDAARREYETAAEMSKKDLIPQSKVDSSLDQFRKAEAQFDAATSAVELARLGLQKTALSSTLEGVVLNVNVRVGDTVGLPRVALMGGNSALFEIAAPLDRMRAIVNVSEADYSRVKVGQSVTFTIDAYPAERFEAHVAQIRNAPTAGETAVSYGTVLEFDNRRDTIELTQGPEGVSFPLKLRTNATETAVVGKNGPALELAVASGPDSADPLQAATEVLTHELLGPPTTTPAGEPGLRPDVPTPSLAIGPASGSSDYIVTVRGVDQATLAHRLDRFLPWMVKPRATISADIQIQKAQNVLAVRNSALLYTPSNFDEEIPSVRDDERLVWIPGPDGRPAPRKVKIGITDGIITQIVEGNIREADEVITGEPLEDSSLLRLPIGN